MEEKKILEVISCLNYDFNQFSLNHFIEYIACRKRREIIVKAYPFQKRELSAIWLPQETAHYIFYNASYHDTHQTHSIIHELAHLILGHRCQDVRELFGTDFLSQYNGQLLLGRPRWIGYSLHNDPEEQEAEFFVGEIQQKVMLANRLDALTNLSSSIEGFDRYVSSAAYNA